jgi:hypothetical protein
VPATRTRKKRTTKRTTAFHAHGDTPDSSVDVIGFGNLRVIVVQDDDLWFATCLDFNYAAQGTSLSEVKSNFERGLSATVEEHLRVFGNIENLLSRPSSSRIRQEIMHKMPQAFRYSQVTVHRLPKELQNVIQFEGIEFIRPIAA